MDKQFRTDLICERTRGCQEVRDELAKSMRTYRLFSPEHIGSMPAMVLKIEIGALKWVLNHNLPLEEWYTGAYKRDMPKEQQ